MSRVVEGNIILEFNIDSKFQMLGLLNGIHCAKCLIFSEILLEHQISEVSFN